MTATQNRAHLWLSPPRKESESMWSVSAPQRLPWLEFTEIYILICHSLMLPSSILPWVMDVCFLPHASVCAVLISLSSFHRTTNLSAKQILEFTKSHLCRPLQTRPPESPKQHFLQTLRKDLEHAVHHPAFSISGTHKSKHSRASSFARSNSVALSRHCPEKALRFDLSDVPEASVGWLTC